MGCYQVKNTKIKRSKKSTKNLSHPTKLEIDHYAQTESSCQTQKLSSPRSFDCHNFNPSFKNPLKNLVPETLSSEDQKFLTQVLCERFIFSQLSLGKINQIARKFKSYSLASGQIMISEGEICNYFLYLKKGFIEISHNESLLATVKKNQSFGELNLIFSYTPKISIKAGEICEVWVLLKEDYRQLMKNKDILKTQGILQGLQKSRIISYLDEHQQELLINMFNCTKYNENEEVTQIKESKNVLYIVGKGKIGVYTHGKFEYELVRSEYLLKKYKFSIKALSKCTLFSLDLNKNDQVIVGPVFQYLYKESVKIAFLKSKILKNLTSHQQDNLVNCIKFESVPKAHKLESLKIDLKEFLIFILKGKISLENKTLGIYSCLGVKQLYKMIEIPNFCDWTATKTTNLGLIKISDIENVLGKSFYNTISSNIKINLLKNVYFFKDLQIPEIESLARKVTKKKFKKNEFIYKDGSTADSFFILIKGRVKIYRDSKVIKQVSNYGCFGESCLINSTSRTTTAISKDSTCFLIQKSDFSKYLSQNINSEIKNLTTSESLSHTLNDFFPLKVLGTGTFGTVFLCQSKNSNNLYAIKSIHRSSILKYGICSNILSEKKTMMYMNHPFIINLYKTFKSDTRLYFLLEYVQGIEFFDLIQKFKVFDITEAKFYSACLVIILEYLHERKIVFRDLKPENIMIDSEGYPKLVDFGMAKIIKNRTCSVLGTPHYMAPEVIKGLNYGPSADLWSFGVILYQLLTKKMPFGCRSDNPKEIYDEVCNRSVDFSLIKNQQGKDIMEKLLNRVQEHRIDLKSIKQTNWFSKTDFDNLLKKKVEVPFKPILTEKIKVNKKDLDIDEFLFRHEEKFEDSEVFDSLYNF